jgi:uncharacterized protein YdeI (YjbR/CyaY-like superfamily)
MPTTDPRVDAYIEKSADFAKPILRHVRQLVHAAVPEVEETMKWSFPHFTYKGMLCSMASFKEHCAINFWKGSLVLGDAARSDEAMGQLGQVTSLADLPPDASLTGYLRTAARLNDEGVKVERPKREPRGEAEVPPELAVALTDRPEAKAAFDGFPPSHRREYVEWITEAKSDATRQKRIAQAVEWIAEGKSRNWKYERK